MMTRFARPLSPMTRMGHHIAPEAHQRPSRNHQKRSSYEAASIPMLVLAFCLLSLVMGVLVLG